MSPRRPLPTRRGIACPGVLLLPLALSGCSHGTEAAGPLPAVESVIGKRGSLPGRFVLPRSLAYDPQSRHLCVVDRSGRIQRFAEQPVSEEAAERTDAAVGWVHVNEWTLPEYKIGQPTRIHFDRQGRLLVADTHYQRVLIYAPQTGDLLGSWGKGGTGEGEFSQIRDVVQDKGGHFFAGDYGGPTDRIHKFDSGGRFLFSFGRSGEEPGEFRRIQALAVATSPSGVESLLVVDSCNHRIQRFSLDGTFLSAWGALGDGPGEFKFPYGIAIEPRLGGDIFVVEWGNNRIQRFDSEGRFLGVWGRPGREPGELATPWDVEVAADGRVFVADYNNNRVQVFHPPERVASRQGRVR